MKNIILVLVGFLVSFYVLLIGVNIYSIQNHKNQLEYHYARMIQQTLEECYISKEEEAVGEILEQKLKDVLGENVSFYVDIQAVDLEQGILSASITEEVPLITGQKKRITLGKTVLVDKRVMNEPMVTLTFQVEGMIYKQYQIVKGEECPCPLPPAGDFIGWKKESSGEMIMGDIGRIWEDECYIAVMD